MRIQFIENTIDLYDPYEEAVTVKFIRERETERDRKRENNKSKSIPNLLRMEISAFIFRMETRQELLCILAYLQSEG